MLKTMLQCYPYPKDTRIPAKRNPVIRGSNQSRQKQRKLRDKTFWVRANCNSAVSNRQQNRGLMEPLKAMCQGCLLYPSLVAQVCGAVAARASLSKTGVSWGVEQTGKKEFFRSRAREKDRQQEGVEKSLMHQAPESQ